MSVDANLLPTTHGSLPYSNPRKAVETVFKFTPEIPSWPQLPKMGFDHNMIVQFGHDLPGIAIDDAKRLVYLDLSKVPSEELEKYYEKLLINDVERFALDEGHFPGFFELVKHEDSLRAASFIKGHQSGPVTMGLQILNGQKTPILYEQVEMELLLKSLILKAQWQQSFLKEFNENTILLFDEPSMTLLGSPCVPLGKKAAAGFIEEVVKNVDGLAGVHCCGNTDWSVLLGTSLDVLSFDAYQWAHTIALYPSEIENFMKRGGKLAWGIIPTLDERIEGENVDSIMTRFQEGLSQLTNKGIDGDLILRSSFVTPACGLGMTTPANAERALDMTREVSRRLRNKHGFLE